MLNNKYDDQFLTPKRQNTNKYERKSFQNYR